MTGFRRTCILHKLCIFSQNSTKSQVWSLRTIKIGTAVKNYVGWYRYYRTRCVFHAFYGQAFRDESWLDISAFAFSQPLPISRTSYVSKNSTKSAASGLGTIKIGTATKSNVGWYRYLGKWFVFSCRSWTTMQNNSWLVSQPSPFSQPLHSLQMDGPNAGRNLGWLANKCPLRHAAQPKIEGRGSSP